MNNPLQFVRAFRNPQDFMQQVTQNSELMKNPIAKNAIQMYQNGDKDGINKLAQNLCSEKGTTFEEMAQQIKSQFGI